ncbi:Zn(II)2Cys6 transcription factor [Aspergillus undulatus]|uniref:Zn(II)2Cys6 transcription factor n=1 Tax=Aspergillus undulatus TaxID=1810928 RepID=UPI003CCDB513
MRGCITCRKRHLKCDKTGPECLRCQRSGRQCIPAPAKPEEVTFRHGQNPSMRSKGPPRYGENDLSFPDGQVWMDVPPELSFEDETDQTASEYHVVSAESSPVVPRGVRKARFSASTSTIPSIPSPTQTFPSGSLESSRRISHTRTLSMDSLLPLDTPRDNPKLADFNQAFLLRHFQRTLGPWLDSCDHERQFSMDVVERAPLYPLLLYACLATAARHLSQTTNLIPPNTADEYHEKCIAILLPGLGNWESKIGLDILLASTVILRFFEQISSHTPSNDSQRHLLAGSVYISSHLDCAVSGGLAEASFWVFVMQDIQFALASQNPLRLELSPFDEKLQQLWTHQTPQTDRDWAHRAVWLLAGVINHCYGVQDPQTSETERSILKHRINAWGARKPDSFRPLHFSLADPRIGRPYPVVWYTKSLYATAAQHISMAKALIEDYELRNLYASLNAGQDTSAIEDGVTKNLGILFGIALSSDGDPAARIMACHALCAFGSWVHDALARRCLLDLLRKTESENGWPWTFVSQRLSQEWRLPAS